MYPAEQHLGGACLREPVEQHGVLGCGPCEKRPPSVRHETGMIEAKVQRADTEARVDVPQFDVSFATTGKRFPSVGAETEGLDTAAMPFEQADTRSCCHIPQPDATLPAAGKRLRSAGAEREEGNVGFFFPDTDTFPCCRIP